MTKVVKVLEAGITLQMLGELDVVMTTVYEEAVKFFASCYGYPEERNLDTLRFSVWSMKMGNGKMNAAPELKVLPPTNTACP